MNSDDKKFILCITAVIALMIGGYASITIYTGFDSPFSVIMSQSMQHNDDRSEIGCIDTGDVVIIRDPNMCQIYSYVEGVQNGYKSFGDYGSVIIYERNQWQNPVIHRAILWLEYDPATDTWSAPSLIGYSGTWYWEHNGIRSLNTTGMKGMLFFEDMTQSKKDLKINLESQSLKNGGSGYLTLGDNINNYNFDQYNGTIVKHLVNEHMIKSIPILEIPWVGTLKILFKNDGVNLEHVPNSIPSFIMAIILLISITIVADLAHTYLIKQKK